jgi:putative oxidoreductase
LLVNLAFRQIIGASALFAGVVLLCAGVPKVLTSVTFAGQISAYGIVPESAVRFVARLISASELLAGIILIVGLVVPLPLRQIGAGLAVLLFATFLAALISAQIRGRNIACACFGGSGELETVGSHSLVRTSLLLIVAVVATLPAHGEHPLSVLGFAVTLAALVAVLSELARLLGPLRHATGSILEQMNAAAMVADETEVTQ